MVPRVDLKVFDIDGEPADLRRFMQEHRLKKVPVYSGDIDHIVGLIYAKSLFLHEQPDLRRLLRPVRYVPEQTRLDQLLEHFRHTKTQIAIVVDEFGGTAGLVTSSARSSRRSGRPLCRRSSRSTIERFWWPAV